MKRSWPQGGLAADVWSGGIMAAFGGAIMIGAHNAGIGTLEAPETGFLAFYLGVILIVCGLMIAVSGVLQRTEDDSHASGLHGVGTGLCVVALLVVYALIVEWAGFLPTTFLLLLGLAAVTERRVSLIAAGYAAALSAATYLLFETLLGSGLPAGRWF